MADGTGHSDTPNDDEVVDADVVEPGTELAVRPPSAGVTAQVVSGADPDEIIAKATKIANSLTELVKQQGFAVNMGGKKPHLEIGAWQALGAMLGALGGEALHAETIWSRRAPEKTVYHVTEKKFGKVDGKRAVVSELEYDVEGYDWEACVEVKTAAGVVIGRAEGMCSRAENSWAKKPDPAVKSMAETRAASRAFRGALGWIVAIAGYNPTPAEEMPAQPPAPVAAPVGVVQTYGVAATEAVLRQTRAAIAYMLEASGDEQQVTEVLAKIAMSSSTAEKGNPYMPYIACRAVCLVATRIKEIREASQLGAGDPAGETAEEASDRARAEQIAAEAGE